MKEWIMFALVGKLLMFVVRKFPPVRDVKNKFLRELIDCDLCLGVWTYTILSFITDYIFEYTSVPIIEQLITGAGTSFLVFLIVLGYQSQFSVIEVG